MPSPRLLTLLICLFAAGCAGEKGPEPTKAPASTVGTEKGLPPAAPEKDGEAEASTPKGDKRPPYPAEIKKLAGWMKEVVKPVLDAEARKNALAEKQALADVTAKVADHRPAEISWTVVVRGVVVHSGMTRVGIDVDIPGLEGLNEPPAKVPPSRVKPATPKRKGPEYVAHFYFTPGEVWATLRAFHPRRNSIEIDTADDKKRAATLSAGDKVEITGTLTAVRYSRYRETRDTNEFEIDVRKVKWKVAK